MSTNIFFSDIYTEENSQLVNKLVFTDNFINADYVVVNDTTTIKEDLKEAAVLKETIELINDIGIFNLAGENEETIHDIKPEYIKLMKQYLKDENIIGGITRVERKEKKIENEGFTCTNCACYPVCKYVDKVDQALKELSKIGIKLTTCDYFVKYNEYNDYNDYYD